MKRGAAHPGTGAHALRDPDRFERGALLVWALTSIAFIVWFVVYALQEFRPAV